VFDDPQVRHRRMKVSAPHPAAGEVHMVAHPIKFSDTPITHETPPPTLGQHTDEVLRGVLGMTSDEIAQLRGKGVV
jgi:crotonobetainyl-CoA:carnitine CoA-transferase CaiB-like acyl-CoA transferase